MRLCRNPDCKAPFSRHGNARYCTRRCRERHYYEANRGRWARRSERKSPTRGVCGLCKRPMRKRRKNHLYHERCKRAACHVRGKKRRARRQVYRGVQWGGDLKTQAERPSPLLVSPIWVSYWHRYLMGQGD